MGKLLLPAQVAGNLIFLTYSVEMKNPQMVSLSLIKLTTDTGHKPLHFNGLSGLAVGKKKIHLRVLEGSLSYCHCEVLATARS